MAIERIEAWTVRFPLRNPVVFGALSFIDRDYAIVRVTDDSGAQGIGYCLARNAPVTAAVGAIAPLVIGGDPGYPEQLWQTLYASTITHGQRGITLRALSLIDIAVWDVRARLVGWPLHKLLGGLRDEVDVGVGGGYYRERREAADIAEELRGYADRGFRLVKIPAGGLSPLEEERWVAAAREALGADVDLALDAHWTWRSVEDAVRVLQRLESFDLRWVEDPLWPEAVAAHAELRRRVRTPIAIGDEQSGRWAFQNLLLSDAADIWRVDVTCVGGFTELRKIGALAATWGIAISPHVYPELHVHAAATEDAILAIEYTDPAADIDLSYRFVTPCLEPHEGRARVPAGPGLGIDLDWEQIERVATERVVSS